MKSLKILSAIAAFNTVLLFTGITQETEELSVFERFPAGEYVLENGLELYALTDSSSPVITVEFTAKAGISKQTPDTTGFFPLYTKIIQKNAGQTRYLKNIRAECNADSARYIITTTENSLPAVLEEFAELVFNPIFSDSVLELCLEEQKQEIRNFAFSVEGFINSAIDSRIFYGQPWKHDSGIYPALFNKTTTAGARKILTDISKRFYNPANCALFITGAASQTKILSLCSQSFGRYVISNSPATALKDIRMEHQPEGKKFILYDAELSNDLVQVVIEYTGLNMEESDLAQVLLDNDYGNFKKSASNDGTLGIRAAQYINASSAHKAESTRLILQTLFENTKNTPVEKTSSFLNHLKNSVLEYTDEDLDQAKISLKNDFANQIADGRSLADYTSQYWAIKDYRQNTMQEKKTLVSSMLSRFTKIDNTEIRDIRQKLQQEEPYIFIITGTKTYTKYKKDFEKAGFKPVTTKNSSWYAQKLYSAVKTQSISSENQAEQKTAKFDFSSVNKSNTQTFVLENNIPVYIFANRQHIENSTLTLVIKGGCLNDSPEFYGMQEVAVNSLCMNLKACFYNAFEHKYISMVPKVESKTGLTQSEIYIDFSSKDLKNIADCIYETIMFSQLIPSLADAMVSDAKSQRIIKVSNPIWQLYSAGITNFYNDKKLLKACGTNQNILQKTDIASINESYITLADASRLSVIICSPLSQSQITENLQASMLKQIPDDNFKPSEIPGIKLSNRQSKKVKLNHQFFTDISADKAGPRPAVLIPTTKFLDPVLYWVSIPENKNKCLYTAVSAWLCAKIESRTHETVRLSTINPQLPFIIFNLLNIEHTSTADSIFKETITELIQELSDTDRSREIIAEIQDAWLFNQMQDFSTTKGTCTIAAQYLNCSNNPFAIFEEYTTIENLTSQKLIEILSQDFAASKIFTVYSADSKK